MDAQGWVVVIAGLGVVLTGLMTTFFTLNGNQKAQAAARAAAAAAADVAEELRKKAAFDQAVQSRLDERDKIRADVEAELLHKADQQLAKTAEVHVLVNSEADASRKREAAGREREAILEVVIKELRDAALLKSDEALGKAEAREHTAPQPVTIVNENAVPVVVENDTSEK